MNAYHSLLLWMWNSLNYFTALAPLFISCFFTPQNGLQNFYLFSILFFFSSNSISKTIPSQFIVRQFNRPHIPPKTTYEFNLYLFKVWGTWFSSIYPSLISLWKGSMFMVVVITHNSCLYSFSLKIHFNLYLFQTLTTSVLFFVFTI